MKSMSLWKNMDGVSFRKTESAIKILFSFEQIVIKWIKKIGTCANSLMPKAVVGYFISHTVYFSLIKLHIFACENENLFKLLFYA